MAATTKKMEMLKVFAATTIRLFFNQGCVKSLGVILNDTVERTGASLPTVAFSFSILQGLSYATAPPVTQLMRVVSSRTVVILGGFLVGAGFICEGFLAYNFWMLFLSTITAGIGFGLNNIPLYIALAETFQDDFGTAMTAIGFLSNIAMAVMPPLLEFWREKYGLTGSLTLFGALMWNQILSGVLIRSQHHKEVGHEDDIAMDEDSDCSTSSSDTDISRPTAAPDDDYGIREAIKSHPTILCLFAAQCSHLFIVISWGMFLLPYGVEKGYTQGEAIFLTTVGGLGLVTGRGVVISVFYLKWQGRLIVMLPPVIMLMASLLLTTYTSELTFLCIESLSVGICLGFCASWMFAYGRDMVCFPHFSAMAAWSMIAIGTGVIVSGPLSGLVHEIRGTYDDVFYFLVTLAAIEGVSIMACITLTRRNPLCSYGDM